MTFARGKCFPKNFSAWEYIVCYYEGWVIMHIIYKGSSIKDVRKEGVGGSREKGHVRTLGDGGVKQGWTSTKKFWRKLVKKHELMAKFQIIHITSKNGPIRTLFEKSWLWVINLALRTRTPGGRGVKNWQNFADVFYGWPLTYITDDECSS